MIDGKIQPYVPCWLHRRLFFHITHAEAIALTGALPQIIDEKGEVITIMPNIRCVECGEDIYIDSFATPYKGELACKNCRTHMFVEGDMSKGFTVRRMFPSLEELQPVWFLLTKSEQSDLTEASKDIGVESWKSAEMVCCQVLENLLKRAYGIKKDMTLGGLIPIMEEDGELKDMAGATSYFKDVYNKLKHVIGYSSSSLSGRSTFDMTKRLVLTIAYRKLSTVKIG